MPWIRTNKEKEKTKQRNKNIGIPKFQLIQILCSSLLRLDPGQVDHPLKKIIIFKNTANHVGGTTPSQWSPFGCTAPFGFTGSLIPKYSILLWKLNLNPCGLGSVQVDLSFNFSVSRLVPLITVSAYFLHLNIIRYGTNFGTLEPSWPLNGNCTWGSCKIYTLW